MTVREIAHILPTTQRVLDDQEATRRAVDREARRRGRLEQLRRWQRGQRVVASTFSTPATEAAIERGVRADSDEWAALVETEVHRVLLLVSDRRRYATKVLDRYDRWVKADRARREEVARRERIEERRTAEVRTLTVPLLCDALDITEVFAQHLVQPYCRCSREAYEDGWYLCDHARDEGIASAYL